MKTIQYIIVVIIATSTKNPIFFIAIFLAYFIYLHYKNPDQIQEIKNALRLYKEIFMTVGVMMVGLYIIMLISPPNLLISLPFFLPAFFFSIFHFRALKKSRLYQDIPTSKMRSVAMGLVEVKGKVEVGDQINNEPIFNKSCVYYNILIARRGRKNRYRTLYRDVKSESFLLKDDTGSILVPGNLIPDIQKHYFQRKDEDRRFLEFEGIDEKDIIKFDYNIESRIFAKKLPIQIKDYLDKIEVEYNNKIRITIKYIEPGDNIYILGTARSLNESEHEYKSRANAAIDQSGENRFTISDFSEKELIKKAKQGSLVRLIMIVIFILIGSIILFSDGPITL